MMTYGVRVLDQECLCQAPRAARLLMHAHMRVACAPSRTRVGPGECKMQYQHAISCLRVCSPPRAIAAGAADRPRAPHTS